jgi:hypothetical protein
MKRLEEESTREKRDCTTLVMVPSKDVDSEKQYIFDVAIQLQLKFCNEVT